MVQGHTIYTAVLNLQQALSIVQIAELLQLDHATLP